MSRSSKIPQFSCRSLGEGALRLVLLACILFACPDVKPKSLPAFNVDLNETSVSGVSSGAYMAVQFEVAHSAIIRGAGIIAGGPYFCAQNDIKRATTLCTCTSSLIPCRVSAGGTDVPYLAQKTRDSAAEGRIDAVSLLSNHRIFLFSGTKDSVVPQAVMNDLESYYRIFVPSGNIRYKNDIPAQHGMPTDSYGKACDQLGEPFMNNCGYDAAGELLKQIYGRLNPRNRGKPGGSFIEFDQGEFIEKPRSHSMNESGWAYVPAECGSGRKCRVHIAFHGCRQGQKNIGMAFIEHAGYNEWADSNNIIVVYPQVMSKKTFGFPGTALFDPNNTNPGGCWNWWGYDNDADYAVRSGRQIAAVKGMLDRLAGKSDKK